MPDGRETEPVAGQRTVAEWAGELAELLRDAVRIRLRADVPVGTYLSGGLDSTLTTALIKRDFNNSLCSFSVRFADDRFDESGFQKTAVKKLNTEQRHVLCEDEDIGRAFPRIIWHCEAPILRTSPAPLFYLSRLVRSNNFKVVLTGEGADEIFAGYNIFKEDQVRRFWARDPESKLRPMLLKKMYPYIFEQQDSKAGAFLNNFFKKGLMEVDSPVYSHLLRWQNTAQVKAFFNADVRKQNGDLSQFIDRYVSTLPPDFMRWHPLTRAQYTEMRIFLPNYLLSSQGDRMTMAHSVEGRYPFLDHRVVELALKMPPRLRLNGLNEKYILKQVAKDIVPAQIVERPKQPYRAPISRCFLGQKPPDYVTELLSESAIRQSGYFEPEKVTRLLAKCDRQNGNLTSERENMALVGILSTQLVDQMFIRDFPAYAVQEPQDVKVFTE
jgi:asparagine synthase (glutamine-hydrolysing)